VDIRANETLAHDQNEVHGRLSASCIQNLPGSLFRVDRKVLRLGQHQEEGGRRRKRHQTARRLDATHPHIFTELKKKKRKKVRYNTVAEISSNAGLGSGMGMHVSGAKTVT